MRQNPRKIPAKAKKVSKPKQKRKPAPKNTATDVYVHNAGPSIPRGAVLADVSQQVPINSYSGQPAFYEDRDFVCVDCGRRETWTARQQKWYYEVAKGSLYGGAIRCRACRAKHRAKNNGRGDPNPIKHLGSVIKRVRLAIEPAMVASGFQREVTHKISEFMPAPLVYTRAGQVLRCGFELSSRKFLIEAMNDKAECQTLSKVSVLRDPTKSIEKIASVMTEFVTHQTTVR